MMILNEEGKENESKHQGTEFSRVISRNIRRKTKVQRRLEKVIKLVN